MPTLRSVIASFHTNSDQFHNRSDQFQFPSPTNSRTASDQVRPILTNSNSQVRPIPPIPSLELELELVGVGIGASLPLGDAPPTQEEIDSSTDDAMLDAYNLERLDPRDIWEQEQLSEFEGFVILEHLQLLRDEIEQQQNIDAQEGLEQTRQRERSEQQLLPFELCDQIDHLLLQMNQPQSYD